MKIALAIQCECNSGSRVLPATHIYDIRPRSDRRGFHLISDALPFGKLWYGDAEAAASYAVFYGRSKDIQIRFFNERRELIETRKQDGHFAEP